MQMSELAWSLTYYSESAVESSGKNIKIIKTFHLAVELKSSMIMIEVVVNSPM